ncbi:MAG: GNAT family N-acetyltransferase [Alphaproteobacteria bacterium]|nr:GNAT family N-acetyltransferase [Alphaproteobacteria bacterium]
MTTKTWKYDGFVIRTETAEDIAKIRQLNKDVFGQENEARLVDQLRDGGHFIPQMSLVAVSAQGEVTGHILLSEITGLTDKGPVKTGAIAPGAVAKQHRSLKLAKGLADCLLEQARLLEFELIMLLARPRVYNRLGFSAELARKIESVYSDAGDAFQALELKQGVISETAWARVTYTAPFVECDG